MRIEMYIDGHLVSTQIVHLDQYKDLLFETRVERREEDVRNTMKAMQVVHGSNGYVEFVLTAISKLNPFPSVKYFRASRLITEYIPPKKVEIKQELLPEKAKPIIRPEAVYSNKQYNKAS